MYDKCRKAIINNKYDHIKIYFERKNVDPSGVWSRKLLLKKRTSWPFDHEAEFGNLGFVVLFTVGSVRACQYDAVGDDDFRRVYYRNPQV